MSGALVGAVLLGTCFAMVAWLTFAQGNTTGGVANAVLVAVISASGHVASFSHEASVAFAFTFCALAVHTTLGATFRHAVRARPSFGTHALAGFLAFWAGRKLATPVRGIAPFWTRFPPTIIASKCGWALAFEVFLFEAFPASTACVRALANRAIVAFKFRIALAPVPDAHTVARARVRARWELAGSTGPHILTQAYAILANTMAVAVFRARFLATVFA